MKREMIAAAALLLVAAGCGDSDETKNATDEPTTSASYVVELNKLCTALIDDVVPITGDSARPTGAKYLADRKKLEPVWAAFDAEVEKLAVTTDADREADEVFDALREAGDVADAAVVAQPGVAEMDATEFQAAFDKALADSGFDDQRGKLLALGVACPAR